MACRVLRPDRVRCHDGGVKRIAILHYTTSPALGGIEHLIDAQQRALVELGQAVRLIAGEGAAHPASEFVRIPEIHPAHPALTAARARLHGRFPPPEDDLVKAMLRRLRAALAGCDQCWVHNGFTVYLNPFLTVALLRLAGEMPEIGWVAWCEDLSSASAYQPALSPPDRQRVGVALPAARYVTISHARRRELSHVLGLESERIMVIPPPLDALTWLDVGAETREIVARLALDTAQPVVLVPAKLLAHKNLEIAVRAAAHLHAPRPLVLLTGAASPHDEPGSSRVREGIRRLADQVGAAAVVHLLTDVIGRMPERRTIRDLMLLADLVFLPSAEEGFGMPLREAAALRTPILCSDIAPFREVGGVAVHYFPLDATPEAVAARMIAIADAPANQKRREALHSFRCFRAQLRTLLYSVPPAPGRYEEI